MPQHIDQVHELLSKTGLQRKSGNIFTQVTKLYLQESITSWV